MNKEQWERMKRENYGENMLCLTEDGPIDFSPDSYRQVEYNGIHISYDEYLNIMRDSGNDVRQYFAMCFYSGGGYADCSGMIENIISYLLAECLTGIITKNYIFKTVLFGAVFFSSKPFFYCRKKRTMS